MADKYPHTYVVGGQPTVLATNGIAFHTGLVVTAHQAIHIELHIKAPLLLIGEKGAVHSLFNSDEPGPDGMHSKVNALITFREGRIGTTLLGPDSETDPITREEDRCSSVENKLIFLQKFGWLIKNEHARAYSKKHKPKVAERIKQ